MPEKFLHPTRELETSFVKPKISSRVAMRSLFFILLMVFLSAFPAAAQLAVPEVVESAITLETGTGKIFGTLSMPQVAHKIPVAVIIAGSGPTDRDGNNPMMINNSLKLLAFELSTAGIASVRYDKRGIGASKNAMKSESELRFDDYVNDAKGWIRLLRSDERFSKIIVIGHSEGSLIGMIAGQMADQFVSIAGVGETADKLIKTQLRAQPQAVQEVCFPIIDSLKNGKPVENILPMFYALFRPSVQPYLISWFKYDPQTEIRKLSIPVLIVQGTNDLQVSIDDAKKLSAASPNARMVLVDKMNHVFRIVPGDKSANAAAYNDASLPIAAELVKNITGFILHH